MNMTRFLLVCFCLLTLIGSRAAADSSYEIQLIYPDNNVSSKSYVEFRTRDPSIAPVSPGHAFVIVGRELDNGLKVDYSIGGFYPKGDGLFEVVKNTLGRPGDVTYKFEDWGAEESYRVQVSPEQEKQVNALIAGWDSKDYNILFQNCAHLMRSVAVLLKLVPSEANRIKTPWGVMAEIKSYASDGPSPPPPPQDVLVE